MLVTGISHNGEAVCRDSSQHEGIIFRNAITLQHILPQHPFIVVRGEIRVAFSRLKGVEYALLRAAIL